jgi:MFS family permease
MFFVEAAFGSYMSILPLWIEKLGAPVTIVGLVLGSSGILRWLTIGPSAGLAERFGVRRTITVVRTVAGVGMLTAALATEWWHIFLMVICTAIGESAFPLAQNYVVARSGNDRVRAFTMVFTVGPAVAFGLAPLVSGGLVALWGMRAAFLLAAVCTAASVACFAGLAVEPTKASGPVAEADRSSYRLVLADPRVRRILTLHFLTVFALALGTSLMPTFLADERRLDPATINFLTAGAAIGTAIYGLTIARVVRLQRAPFVGIVTAVAGVAVAIGTVAIVDNVAWIALAFVLRGGFFSAWALFVAALGEVANPIHRARAFACSEMLGGGAFSFAPMAAGRLYAISPATPLIASVLLASALVPVLWRTQRIVSATAATRPAVPTPIERGKPDPTVVSG